MPETSVFIPLVFLYGTIGFVLLALSVFVFMLNYQNKMLQHQREINAKDEEHERLVIQSLMQGQEKEQERIGRELHDSMGMDLSRIKMKLYEVRLDMEQAGLDTTHVEQARQAVSLLNDNVRTLSHTMIPDSIVHRGLVASLSEMVEWVNESKTTKVVLHADEEVDTYLNDDNKLSLFRAIQELTHNAIRHAKVQLVTIELKLTDTKRVMAQVSDTGVGFEIEELAQTDGVGLRNVKSRVRIADGELTLKTAPGFGTVATIII
jgi:two-component system NarL family sensor kinase